MKIGLNSVGAILAIFGGIWFLQGINVLPGSFMSGQTRWAIIGGIAVVVGIALMVVANRRRLDG
jgi:drug/metabolite transporter superfamily protein YnfA